MISVLNRILNVLIAIVAILTVVFGYKLYDRRKELRERADLLASRIFDAAKKLDPHSPTAIASSLDASSPDKPLGWKSYHDSPEQYKKNLETFVTTVEKVRTQRDNLGAKLAELAKIFELTNVNTAALNNPEMYKGEYNKIEQHLITFYKRDQFLTKHLIETAQQLDP
ncbi:MAG: hypothetical protein D6820_07855, partial [Lentisphaerae bacterium]